MIREDALGPLYCRLTVCGFSEKAIHHKGTKFTQRATKMGHDENAKIVANDWSKKAIGAAIEVHKQLGPGLLESAYEACLCRERELRAIPFARQMPMALEYKGLVVENAYKIDVLIAGVLVIELKAVEALEPIHDAQLLTYLRLSNRWLGLLMNFNVPVLKDGIKRLVLG
jgi:GxxExxY protein